MAQTVLKFYRLEDHGGSYLPLGSARGCKQTLAPLKALNTCRTIDGRLLSMDPVLDKYVSTIVCSDRVPPALEGLSLGTRLRVECLQHIVTPLIKGGGKITLSRPAVPESVLFFCDTEELPVSLSKENEADLCAYTQEGHLIYRPILDMMVMEYAVETEEWNASTSWKMVLHEV